MLTVILLVPVLFGAAALSVDVGNLMWERRQLQNGADATVMLAAQKCADAPTACSPSAAAGSNLDTIDNANANDGVSRVRSVCGSAAAVALSPATLTPCPSNATPGVTDCPTVPTGAAGLPYLEARTETKTPAGTSTISNKFARMLVGGTSQSTVVACARAGWGPVNPTTLNVLPIVVSYCEWARQTGYKPPPGPPAVYPPSPDGSITPYGYGPGNPWSTSWEKTIYTKGAIGTCPTWNGHTAPGGFSQLDTVTTCSVATTNGDWYHGQPGNSTPCPDASFNTLVGTIVYLPIFDCMTNTTSVDPTDPATNCNSGNGNNTYYHVSGYAAFYLTGWYFSSSTKASIVTGNVPCTGGDRCMSGWFTKDLITAAQLQQLTNPPGGGAPNYGLTQVGPLG
ncbi:pilus assembly protein TadG-related protein [Knoellia koreensis]|uniref:Pilus assembly protein n=1 Tax=Knoellia koreensis TaxID=2730921 RepID=A0A849HEH3_9MICO|nr:pilus assembly protein [Knoellia sp. DB2414S]